jgi:glutamate-1-semialdehyde 2,1-aminomutase
MLKPNHRDLTKSNAHYRRALKRLPLGVSSTFRYWGDDRTIYVHHGKGGRTWDIDGNCYVDYRLGYGPAILGYADDRVDEAARKGMEVGGVFALSTERELAVADRIARMVPSIDLVRFSNSGTEAVMAALRLARAYTGRDSYVLVEGSYHGLFDAAMWMANLADWDPASGLEPVTAPYSKGIPRQLKELAYLTPMNDAERLEDIFRKHGSKLAAMLIEPMMGNCCAISATTEFVRTARALCDKFGVQLIIDEVKTGFRVAKGGVQSLHGVRPDITTFAKAMANGFPIAAIGGREEVMRLFRYGGAAQIRPTAYRSLPRKSAWRSSTRRRRSRRSLPMANSSRPASSRSSTAVASSTRFRATRPCSACSSRPSRRRTTVPGSAPTTASMTRWPTTCMILASLRAGYASRGSCARPTIRAALPTR